MASAESYYGMEDYTMIRCKGHIRLSAILCVLLLPVTSLPEAANSGTDGAVMTSPVQTDTARIRQLLRNFAVLLPNNVPGAAAAAFEALDRSTSRTSPRLLAEIHNAIAEALLPREGGTRVRMHLEKALHFAKRAKDAAGQVKALCGLSVLEVRIAHYNASHEYLVHALELAGKAADSRMLGHVRYHLGYLMQRQQRWQPAVQHFHEAVKEFNAAGTCDERIEALSRLANSLWMVRLTGPIDGTALEVKDLFAKAWALSDSCGGKRSRSILHVYFGELTGWNGNREKACEYFSKARDLAADAGDSARQLRAMSDLAVNHSRRNLYATSFKIGQECMHIAETINDQVTAASFLVLLGVSVSNRGNPKAGEPYFHNGIARYKKLRDTTHLILNWMALATNYRAQERYDEARQAYHRSFELAKKMGSHYFHRCGLLNYGQFEFNHHRYEHARESFLEAEKLLPREKVTHNHAILYWHLGRVNRKLENWDVALNYYNRAIHIIEKIGTEMMCIEFLHGPASLHLDRGSGTGSIEDLQTALDQYSDLLARAEQCGLKTDIARCHHNMGFLLTKLHQPQKALQHLRAALAYRQKHNHRHDHRETITRLTGTIGRALLQLGRSGAYDTLALALHLYNTVDDPEGLRDFCRDAAIDLERRGDYKRAFAYHQRYAALRDSLQSAKHVNALQELNVRYETAQREREIELLKKQKSIDRLRLRQQKDELQRRALLDERRRQDLLLLERENEIQQLELVQKESALHMQRLSSAKDSSEAALWKQRSALKQATLGRHQALITGLAAALLLSLIIAWLVYRRIQGRRREAALRADAAEYKAAAAKSEQHRLAAAHARREKDMQRAVTRRLIETQEQERQRIAGDLHDSLGQELVVIKNRAMLAAQKSGDGKELHRQLDEVISMTGAAMNTVREISHDLRPTELDRLGLAATLRSVVQKAQHSLPRGIETDIDPIDGLLDKKAEILIYRIVQEGISNVIRHAGAEYAEVRARLADGELAITIRDNGKGIPDISGKNGGNGDGMGLRGMQERAAILGGTMTVTSARNEGTQLHIRLPFKEAAAAQVITRGAASAD